MTRLLRSHVRRTLTLTLAIVASIALAPGCATPGRSSLTPGMAKKHITPGETHQATVIEIFGPPNIVTYRDGSEMWVYDKVSSRQTRSAFGMGGGGGGIGTGGAGGGLIGGGTTSTTRSETTVMLIVYYDKNDIVSDYQLTQTKF